MNNKKYLVWFKQVDKHDVGLVGGKGANLGEITQAGFPVPPGFIITSSAYYYFVLENNLQTQIKRILTTINIHDPQQLQQASIKIKDIIIKLDRNNKVLSIKAPEGLIEIYTK